MFAKLDVIDIRNQVRERYAEVIPCAGAHILRMEWYDRAADQVQVEVLYFSAETSRSAVEMLAQRFVDEEEN